MIDSHVHLSYKFFDQTFPYINMSADEFIISTGTRENLLAEMKEQGIECCIEPAIDVASNGLLLKLSAENKGFIYPAVGNHPTRCINSSIRDFKRVRDYSKADGIVAIGETGLDYHFERKDQHRLKQKIWFQWQINLAHKLKLPLVLHIREADEDAIHILRRNKKRIHGGVCHCFCGDENTARVYTEELGLYLGIGGTLLMKQEISKPLQQAVAAVSLENILLETDGPYVRAEKPEGITGKKWMKARNTSLILPKVAKRIAEIKGVSVEEVLMITTDNAKKVFRIP